MHQQVMKSWKGKSALALDLSKVSDIDASFIQLLMSCKQAAQQKKQSFELLNASEELTQMMDAMFTTDFFSTDSGTKAPEPTGA